MMTDTPAPWRDRLGQRLAVYGGAHEHPESLMADLRAALAALEAAERERAMLAAQIDDLARWILAHVPGEPSRSEGAIPTALRLLAQWQAEAAAWRARAEDLADELEAERTWRGVVVVPRQRRPLAPPAAEAAGPGGEG